MKKDQVSTSVFCKIPNELASSPNAEILANVGLDVW